MPKAKDDHGYPLTSINHKDGGWHYLERSGVTVVVGVKQTTISWRQIEAAMRVRSAAKRKR